MSCRIRTANLFFFLVCVLLLPSVPAHGQGHELLDFIKTALQQSDAAYDLRDLITLSDMAVKTEEHDFDYQVIPLTNIGFARDVGSQTLGMEIKQKHGLGTQITAGLRGDRTDLNPAYVVENSHTARAYLKISQGLFRRWGKKYNLSSLNIAKLKRQEQQLNNARSRQDLILQTATNYYQVLLAKRLIKTSEQALVRSREHLEAATSRQSIGLVSKVDVYRAEIAALNAESNNHDKKLGFRKTMDTFRESLGMADEAEITVAAPVSMITPVVPEDWEEALLQNRLDWQSYRLQKEYGALALYQARENLSPDLSLNFGVEQKGEGDSIDDASEMNQTNWSIQLELSSPLDLFHEKNTLARETINTQKLHRKGAALKRKIIREVRESFEDLKAQERFYQINLKRMEQAGNALELTKIRYERGLSDNIDVLDAESALSTAEFDASKALVAYNIAAIKLANSLGVLDLEWLSLSLEASEEDGRTKTATDYPISAPNKEE